MLYISQPKKQHAAYQSVRENVIFAQNKKKNTMHQHAHPQKLDTLHLKIPPPPCLYLFRDPLVSTVCGLYIYGVGATPPINSWFTIRSSKLSTHLSTAAVNIISTFTFTNNSAPAGCFSLRANCARRQAVAAEGVLFAHICWCCAGRQHVAYTHKHIYIK